MVDDTTIGEAETTEELKDWTVMVYMAGDNNLGVDMAYALDTIKKVAYQFKGNDETGKTEANINLLVYYDGNASDVPTLYCDFTNCHNPKYIRSSSIDKRYKYENKAASKRQHLNEENSAAMYSVMNFVDWCVNEVEFNSVADNSLMKGRKAKNYAMIFSGHGFGFQSLTFLKDNDSDYYMSIKKLRSALEKLKNDKKIFDGNKLAILGFDSCVMGMLEVGNELKDVAKTMIASEGTIPNAGWTYEPILKGISNAEPIKDNDDDVIKVAKGIVTNFITTQQQFAIGGVSVDLSVWDLTKVEPIVTAVNTLGEILLKGLQHQSVSHLLEIILLKCHFKSQSFMFEQNVDLIDFCEILQQEAKLFNDTVSILLDDDNGGESNQLFVQTLSSRCDAVIAAVLNCVKLHGFCGGKFQHSRGVSIFFPWTYYVFLLSNVTYNNLAFAEKDKGMYWRDFLFHFLSETSLRGRNEQVGKIIDGIESKTTENPKTRTTENPKTRLVENLAGVRTTENPRTRTTENPKTRMLDANSQFLNDFKNVTNPWFVAGFIPKQDAIETTDDPYKKT
jgi:Clostripain family